MQGILFRADVWKAKFKVLKEKGEAQTRRLSGLKEINKEPDRWRIEGQLTPDMWAFTDGEKHIGVKPRYQIGEVAYIQEAWAEFGDTSEAVRNGDLTPSEAKEFVIYRLGHKDWQGILRDIENGHEWNIKSPLFMPAWAARHFITITGIKEGRLQEMTEEDAMAEGVDWYSIENKIEGVGRCQQAYRKLWDLINPKYPWDSNPWNFAYSFKLIDKLMEARISSPRAIT